MSNSEQVFAPSRHTESSSLPPERASGRGRPLRTIIVTWLFVSDRRRQLLGPVEGRTDGGVADAAAAEDVGGGRVEQERRRWQRGRRVRRRIGAVWGQRLMRCGGGGGRGRRQVVVLGLNTVGSFHVQSDQVSRRYRFGECFFWKLQPD